MRAYTKVWDGGDEEGGGEARSKQCREGGKGACWIEYSFTLGSDSNYLMSLGGLAHGLHWLILAVFAFWDINRNLQGTEIHSYVEIENTSTKILFFHLSRSLKEGSQLDKEVCFFCVCVCVGGGIDNGQNCIFSPWININKAYSRHTDLPCGTQRCSKTDPALKEIKVEQKY